MEYKGKLYGKVHKSYFPLEETTESVYTEEECRNMVFDYAQFVMQCMDGIVTSMPVGVWFDKNKKQPKREE
jgi:hypothetical protein